MGQRWVANFLDCLKGHDEQLLVAFASPYSRKRVFVGGIAFDVYEETISQPTKLTLDGRCWKRTNHVANSEGLELFFCNHEEPIKLQGGFSWEELKHPWNMIYLMIMKYFTLKRRHKVFYYYHLPLLNHFCNNDLLCLSFYLLHSIESSIKDTMYPKHGDKTPHLLH